MRLWLFWAAIAASLTGCSNSDPEKAAIVDAAPRPAGAARLILPETERDLGATVIAGDEYFSSFPILNAGQSSLEIRSLSKSCLCTTPQISHTVIAPDESAELTVTVRPEEAGPGRAHVTIESSDPEQPFRKVWLTWTASAPLEIEPPQIRLGRIDVEDKAVFEAKLIQRTPECTVVRVLSSSSDRMNPAILTDNEGSVLQIVIDAGWERGPHDESVTLELEGCWRTSITVPVSWLTSGIVEVKPLRLFLGAGHAGEELSQTLSLYRGGRKLARSRRHRMESAHCRGDGRAWFVEQVIGRLSCAMEFAG